MSSSRWLATGAAYIVPNFSALNVISSVAHSNPVAGQLILYNSAYALVYATVAHLRCGAGVSTPEPEMSRSRQVTVVFSVLLAVCLTCSIALLRRLDQLRTGATLEDVLYISSPKALKRLSLGYDGLLADIYWTRAVQYFGSKHHEGAQHYDLLAPLLEITTDARSSPAGGVRIRR